MVILIYLWNMSIESHSLTADVGWYLGWWRERALGKESRQLVLCE